MTVLVKQGGQYLDPVGVFVKKGGVYSRALGVFGKVAASYQPVDVYFGPELIVGSSLDSAAPWAISGTDASHTITFSGGTARYVSSTTTPAMSMTQAVLTVGKLYELTVVVSAWTSGSLKTDALGVTGTQSIGGVGTFVRRAVATQAGLNITRATTNVDITLDSVSVREVITGIAPERLQLSRIKTALNTAPASLAEVPRTTLDITYGGQDEVPANLGGYVRHYIGGEGTQGYGSGAAMDLPVVTHMEIRANLGRIWHGGTYNCHDGSRAQWFQINSNYGPGRAGDNSGFFIGFRLRNGQRFSFTTHTYCRGTIVVDGKVSQMWVPQGGYVNVNLGSVGDRVVILQGGPDMTLADICVEQNAVIEPYNFMVNKLRVNHGGDSYSQGGVDGFMFGEALGLLTGGGHYAGTAIGGTGYSTNNRNFETPNLLEPARFNAMTTGNPDVVWIMMGINDGWPSSNNADATGQVGVIVDTTQAMRDTYINVRAKLPNALIVVVSGWVPKESDATNPNGKAKLMADAMRATVKAHLKGSWIFMDVNDGSWETSAGTKSPTPRGPWITGNGYVGNTTGQGRADTWVGNDGTHLTEVGFRGVIGIAVSDYKAALASM